MIMEFAHRLTQAYNLPSTITYHLSGFETVEDCPMLPHHRATVYIQIRTQSTYAHWHARPQSPNDQQGQAKSPKDVAAFQTHGRAHDLCFISTVSGFYDD
jgi:hypothetical protein